MSKDIIINVKRQVTNYKYIKSNPTNHLGKGKQPTPNWSKDLEHQSQFRISEKKKKEVEIMFNITIIQGNSNYINNQSPFNTNGKR